MACEGEGLRPLRFFGANGGVSVAPHLHNDGDGGERFDVVDDGRFPEKAGFGGEGWLRRRHAALSLDGGDERRLLAADKCPAPSITWMSKDLPLPKTSEPRIPARRASPMAMRSRLTASGYSVRT
jgi:hypothetical protein